MKNGLTLTELLVATILMGIVMAGVAAFSVFVKQARDSAGSGSVLAVQTAAAMHYLIEDANKAVGDSSAPGVVGPPAQESICFRHDVSDPTVYTDDTWACYWYENSSAALWALWKCTQRNAITFTPPPANFSDCNQGSNAIKLVTLNPAAAQYFSIGNDASGRFEYVDITLNTIANPGQPASTIGNPTYELFTRVSPPAHGR